MNLQATFTVNAIGIYIAVITWLNSHIVRERRTLDDNLFSIMLLIAGGCCILEPVTFLIDGRIFPGAYLIILLTNSLLFFASCAFSLLWCLYVDHKIHQSTRRFRQIYSPFIVVCCAGWIGVIGNIPGHYFFSVDAQYRYQREPLGYLMFALPVVASVLSLITVYKARKANGTARFFPVWAFLTPFFLGIAVQTLVYGISLAWCSVSIGLGALYMNLQNELVYRDPLTRLYNRNYLNHILSLPAWNRSSHGGIMIDVDFFKSINDTYGHSMGDEALCDLSAILQESALSDSLIFRFAGDEFILLTDSSSEEDLFAVKNCIQAAVSAFNAQGKRPYTLSLSMGHCMYLPGEHDADSFLIAMDKSMYENKRLHHEAAETKN